MFGGGGNGASSQFVKTRISNAIFNNELPDPRDVIIICLINTCGVFRFMFQLDEEAEKRIDFICKMDLIGQSIATAVSHNLAGPLLRRSALSKKIPRVSLRKLLFNRNLRSGNVPAMFADLAKEYGPVFELRPPFAKPMIFLAGPDTNRWTHRNGRIYPIVPMSMRDVMNSCLVEGYELPVGSRVIIAQTASHYMEDSFPDPFKFDIDRYLPPRSEHTSPGYAPYGLGTHKCLGSRWMELQLAVNVLMVAHYFNIEVFPSNYKLRFNPLPSMKPSKKLRFRIAERRRDLQV